jgi:TolB protein
MMHFKRTYFMNKTILKFLLISLFTLSSLALPVRAELRVDFTQGTMKPMPIAIVDFTSDGGSYSGNQGDLTTAIPQVITADLKRSGLFSPLDPAAFIQNPDEAYTAPRHADWRVLNAQALVVGKISQYGGKVRIQFQLFDVLTEQVLGGFILDADLVDPNEWRRVAHKFADAIYKAITGEEGYFDTRIVYVAESGSGRFLKTRLAIIDQDGANHRYLSDGKNLVMTPRFSPNMHQITFMDYGPNRKTPRVYVMDTDTNSLQKRQLGHFPGMSFAPRFSPNGENVIMSMSQQGNSSIYTMNLKKGIAQRLTTGPVIDTSASYSPKGDQIVFNSDRGGNQQLYTMNADGTNIQRISFGGGRYATPVWSPRGDLIAFTKMDDAQFYIGVMRPDGTGERLVAQGYLVEEPSWAPNGRVLIFTRQERKSKSQLYMVDITGYNEQRILTPSSENALSPAWSPLIP